MLLLLSSPHIHPPTTRTAPIDRSARSAGAISSATYRRRARRRPSLSYFRALDAVPAVLRVVLTRTLARCMRWCVCCRAILYLATVSHIFLIVARNMASAPDRTEHCMARPTTTRSPCAVAGTSPRCFDALGRTSRRACCEPKTSCFCFVIVACRLGSARNRHFCISFLACIIPIVFIEFHQRRSAYSASFADPPAARGVRSNFGSASARKRCKRGPSKESARNRCVSR